jgi:D-hexose-6-phosphate mutarotase
LSFRDNADPDNLIEAEGGLAIRGEVERLYRGAERIWVACPGPPDGKSGVQKRNLVEVDSTGFPEMMVWNPGPHINLADLPASGYRSFICIEPAIVDQRVTLVPGATWRGAQVLRVG